MNLKFIILYLFPKGPREKCKRHLPLVWLINLAGLFILCAAAFTVLFRFSEQVSWIEAFWQMWQTVTTVGYGNRPAETVWGRVTTMMLGTSGLAILPVAIAALFDIIVYRKDLRRYGLMKNPHRDGYVIFNFPGEHKLISFINELRHVEKDVGICVVDSRLSELPSGLSMMNNVHFIKSDLLDRETYEKASLLDNRAVIVFPLESSVPDSDSSTRTIVELVSKFVGDRTRIMHILVDPRNEWLFEGLPSVSILEDLEMLAIVQECQDPFSSMIVETLFKNSEDTNPRTVTPGLTIGWTWHDLLRHSVETAARMGIRAMPFALVKEGKSMACPPPALRIEKGDLLSLITTAELDWEKFEQEIVNVSRESGREVHQ